LVHVVDFLQGESFGLRDGHIQLAQQNHVMNSRTSGTQNQVKMTQQAQVEPQMKKTLA
jgi:hypothetical protein